MLLDKLHYIKKDAIAKIMLTNTLNCPKIKSLKFKFYTPAWLSEESVLRFGTAITFLSGQKSFNSSKKYRFRPAVPSNYTIHTTLNNTAAIEWFFRWQLIMQNIVWNNRNNFRNCTFGKNSLQLKFKNITLFSNMRPFVEELGSWEVDLSLELKFAGKPTSVGLLYNNFV